MLFAAHVAVLRKPDEKGFAQRAHLLGLVKRGRATAAQIEMLEGPPFPDVLDYLWEWHVELVRTRNVGMNGAEPLTYQAIDAWARLTDRQPLPHEVEALLQLDAVTRHPEAMEARD
jgi:hypothetical protein